MTSSLSFTHGEVYLINELPSINACVSIRTIGRLKQWITTTSSSSSSAIRPPTWLLELQDPLLLEVEVEEVIYVDVEYLLHKEYGKDDQEEYKIGSMYMFIGEFNPRSKVLKARIGKNMDGLDYMLYKRVMLARRQQQQQQQEEEEQ